MPTLVVQMGHTGRPPNPGARGTAGEQDFTRAVGAACERLLHGRGGWTVRLVIADPPAASYRGDGFVAIHADGSTNPAVRGGSIGYQTPEGRAFAAAWKAAYERRGFDGGWQPDNYTVDLAQYYGVRAAVAAGNRRAFIAECGHLTSPADRSLLLGPGGQDRVALAIGEALGIPVEDDMPLTDADTNKVWMQPCIGRDPGNPDYQEVWPAVVWLTTMAYRIRDIHDWVAGLVGGDASAVTEATVHANLAPMLVEALRDQLGAIPDEELGRLRAAIEGESARRTARV